MNEQRMYIGPSIPGIVKYGTVFIGDLPGELTKKAAEIGSINNLVIPAANASSKSISVKTDYPLRKMFSISASMRFCSVLSASACIRSMLPSFFTQNLPTKEGKGDENQYPYVRVCFDEEEIKSRDDPLEVYVYFIIGIIDKEKDKLGSIFHDSGD